MVNYREGTHVPMNKIMDRMCDLIIYSIIAMIGFALLFMFIAVITGNIEVLNRGNCQW